MKMSLIVFFVVGFGAGYLTNDLLVVAPTPTISEHLACPNAEPIIINPNAALLESMTAYRSAFKECRAYLKDAIEENEALEAKLRKAKEVF